MLVEYTMFGETRLVEGYIVDGHTEYDEIIWVERPEDWYALQSPRLRDKRVLVIRREDWLNGKVVNK